MVVDSGNLLFFFGAGASAEFGIPPMRKMAADFQNKINRQKSQEKQAIYKEIIEMLKDDMGPQVDIEAIFSVIDGLQEYNVENIGELSIYVSKRVFKDTLLHKEIPSKTVLQSLEKDFQRFIRRSCALKSRYRNKMSNIFTSFFNTIGDSVMNTQKSVSNIKYDNRWTLFTTNYDRCLEAFWRENVQIAVDTGFRDRSGYLGSNATLKPDYFLYSFGSELQFLRNAPTYLRVVKLHGSTTWLIRHDTGETEEQPYDIDQSFDLGAGSMYSDELVIYPLRQKQLYVDPYIQMFFLLNEELRYKKVWIIIGYSFRDPVIQNIFKNHFNDGKKMILIHPHPDEVKQRFPEHEEDIIIIEKHFGRPSDQSAINKAIKEELKKL